MISTFSHAPSSPTPITLFTSSRLSGHPLTAAQFGDTLLAAQTRKENANLLLQKIAAGSHGGSRSLSAPSVSSSALHSFNG
jgi:hypothetical protein